jgi:hypothetical protein
MFWTTPNPQYPWRKETVTFTHQEHSSSASLTFIQSIVGLNAGCVPCAEGLFVTNVKVTELSSSPVLTVTKALGAARITDTDQFTVQILQNGSTVNATTNSTTSGLGATVNTGSGTTGPTTLVAGTSYTIKEIAAGTTRLGQYNSALSCTNAAGQNKPLVLNTPFTLQEDEAISCKITNTAKPVTLQVRQVVLSPVPVNLKPPFTFGYTGNNGWGTPSITNTALNVINSTTARPLAATNTATTVSTTLPGPRWFVSTFACTDTNAAATGNPTGTLVSPVATSVTVPAANVRAGAALRCTLVLGHQTP